MMVILDGDARAPFKSRSAIAHEGLVFGSSHRFHCSNYTIRNWEFAPLLSGDFASCREGHLKIATLVGIAAVGVKAIAPVDLF